MKKFSELREGDEILVIDNKTVQSFYARVTAYTYFEFYYRSSSANVDYAGLFEYEREKSTGIDFDNDLTVLIPTRENSIISGEVSPGRWTDLGENSKLWVVNKKKSCYEIKEDKPFLVFMTNKWVVLLIHNNTIPIRIEADSVVENENYIISISKSKLCKIIKEKLNSKINFNLTQIEEYKKQIKFLKQS